MLIIFLRNFQLSHWKHRHRWLRQSSARAVLLRSLPRGGAKGWCRDAGKKDVCPVCMEKVDLRELYRDRPWETSNLTWCDPLTPAAERSSTKQMLGCRLIIIKLTWRCSPWLSCVAWCATGYRCWMLYGIWLCGTPSYCWACTSRYWRLESSLESTRITTTRTPRWH